MIIVRKQLLCPSAEWLKTVGEALALKSHAAPLCFSIGTHVEKEGGKILTFFGATKMR